MTKASQELRSLGSVVGGSVVGVLDNWRLIDTICSTLARTPEYNVLWSAIVVMILTIPSTLHQLTVTFLETRISIPSNSVILTGNLLTYPHDQILSSCWMSATKTLMLSSFNDSDACGKSRRTEWYQSFFMTFSTQLSTRINLCLTDAHRKLTTTITSISLRSSTLWVHYR